MLSCLSKFPFSPRIQILREIRNMIPTGVETRSSPRAETLRTAEQGPVSETRLDEIRTRPADDARECDGCFGAIAPSLDALRPSPCSPYRVVQGVRPSG